MTSTILNTATLERVMSPAQMRSIVYAPRHKLTLWQGAVSGGKTIASLWAFLMAVAKAPRTGVIVIVGKTLATIYQNLFLPLSDRQLFGSLSSLVRYTRGATSGSILGREVMVVGASDIRSEQKIRGMTVCLAYVDEATLVPEAMWDMLITRLRVVGARLLGTTNPGPRNHYLNVKWIQTNRVQSFSFKMRDNPSLTEEYIAEMERSFTGVFYQRFILGLWTNAEGAIFDMWDPALHVVPWTALPPMQRIPGAGLDYGTQNASAGGVLGWGQDNILYIVNEWRHDARQAGVARWTDAQITGAVVPWFNGQHTPSPAPAVEWLYVDPSAASLKAQFAYDNFYRVANADNSVVDGIRLCASLLSAGRLKIADNCRHLIGEMPGYQWDEKAAAKGEDKPVKVDDHSVDGALRYPVASTQSLWARAVMPAARAA